MFDTEEVVYARTTEGDCTRHLKLTGREELNYYIKINKAGKVVEYYTSDGTYQYSYSGTGLNIEDIDNAVQVATASASDIITITCTGVSGSSSGGANVPSVTNIAECVTEGCTKTTAGTELIVGGDHFYVISSDSTNTVLLVKYDLKSDGNDSYEQNTSGLCSNSIKIAFAEDGYWEGCVSYYSDRCMKTDLVSPYNENGASYSYQEPYTNLGYVYDSHSYLYPIVNSYTDKISESVGVSMSGRLISQQEVYNLGIANENGANAIKNPNSCYYWTGSPYNSNAVKDISPNGQIGTGGRIVSTNSTCSIRPVLEIPTSAL